VIPAYIAGPYAGPTPDAIAENVRRAVNLARWAVRQGYAPECVHAAIAAGCYGDDASPEDRERGLRICEARVTMTAKASGVLFAIFRDEPGPDGNPLSSGTYREYLAFQSAYVPRHVLDSWRTAVKVHTWAEWVAMGVAP